MGLALPGGRASARLEECDQRLPAQPSLSLQRVDGRRGMFSLNVASGAREQASLLFLYVSGSIRCKWFDVSGPVGGYILSYDAV